MAIIANDVVWSYSFVDFLELVFEELSGFSKLDDAGDVGFDTIVKDVANGSDGQDDICFMSIVTRRTCLQKWEMTLKTAGY